MTDTIDQLFDNISVQLSHVLLASQEDSQSLINLNKIRYKQSTHISNQGYYDTMTGIVYRRNMNQFVADTFDKMLVYIRNYRLSQKKLYVTDTIPLASFHLLRVSASE